jgi:hypothetical protein
MLRTTTSEVCSSSFRDPAGYVFLDNGIYKRAVTVTGEADYREFVKSGLYDDLVRKGLIVAHEETPAPDNEPDICTVLVPEQIQHISYPYEWGFGQLRDAALLTLEIQKIALQHGMSLKDASAFNIQFRGPCPVFIDTLSFEHNNGGPWVAYSQFCRHFLAPLLLMSRVAPGFNQFLRASLDGFPLDLASALLPASTYLNVGALIHIHMHARSQKKYSGLAKTQTATPKPAPRQGSDPKPGFVESLTGMVRGLGPGKFHTEWIRYYEEASHYSSAAENSKKDAVGRVLDNVSPRLVYDLGGNVGEYSRLATRRGIDCVCYDIDPLCVHQNYQRARQDKDKHMLPLMMDLSNPTPAVGFDLQERSSLIDRSRADLLLALALIHHLRITANAPLERIAAFLSRLGRRLLIEYVPKHDPMAQVLLRSRPDTFPDYTEDLFRAAFAKHFTLEETFPVADTSRTLYQFAALQ